jgi:hypothetical protein
MPSVALPIHQIPIVTEDPFIGEVPLTLFLNS